MDPLIGWTPRAARGEEVKRILDGSVNPFTRQPFSETYKEIHSRRVGLPVYCQMDDFLKIFQENQVIIVDGVTGSGKTTQIPQLVAYSDLPHLSAKRIACTRPSQPPAVTLNVARRVAEEMDVQLGKHVGYSMPFEDVTEPSGTLLTFMTDETLLREAFSDPELTRYSTIVIDGAHVRTVATDILMAFLKLLMRRRADLHVVVICASSDVAKLQHYMSTDSNNPIPLVRVDSISYPVEVYYTQAPELDYIEAAIRTTLTIHMHEAQGDILLFLAGEDQVEVTCRTLRSLADELVCAFPDVLGSLLCLPVHCSLSAQQFQRLLEPGPGAVGDLPPRRVFVGTDTAAMAIPLPGIVFVVDAGFTSHKIYNPRIRAEATLSNPISKAAALQRAKSAGCTRPGKCFRLYTESDFIKELEENTHPEISRVKFASTLAGMLKAGFQDPVRFDYLDAPAPETLMRGLEELNFLEALDDDGNLTPLGSMMTDFPLSNQLAKMLICSPEFGCSNEILTIVSMLSVSSVFVRPPNFTTQADPAKATFNSLGGDHLTLLNVYNAYILNRDDRHWCRDNFLNERALVEAVRVRAHLKGIMERHGVDVISNRDIGDASIRKALVSGLLMQVAHRERQGPLYHTVKDNQVAGLHPGCSLSNRPPEWVVFNEFVITSRPYLRTVTEIRPEWLLELAPLYYDLSGSGFPDGSIKRALQRV